LDLVPKLSILKILEFLRIPEAYEVFEVLEPSHLLVSKVKLAS